MYILILTICGFKGNVIHHIPGFSTYFAADSAGLEWLARMRGPDKSDDTVSFAVVNTQLEE